MNTTLAPMIGRELTDDELAAFNGGASCSITIGKNSVSGKTEVDTRGDCSNVTIIVKVQA